MIITKEYKQKVADALLQIRNNFDGSDKAFATQWSMNNAVFSRLKSGELDGLLKDNQWLSIGMELNVNLNERKWVIAKTDVFKTIEEDILFCKEYGKARICVDDCGIGKTATAKYLSKTLKNCFYVDASQAKTKQAFVRLLAKTIGVDHTGKYADIKALIKYYLKQLPQPMVIIDEAGDLDVKAFVEIKEFWNATENVCGWYLLGADGLRKYISTGIERKKVGFREIFNRFSDKYTSPVPTDRQQKLAYYRKLITDVLSANHNDNKVINEIVQKCLIMGEDGQVSGLRRAESLLILYTRGQ
ncbi:MAG: ATP-binding protein [Sphingobacteriaceae bacterium]|nr:ATP-binding protein [Sphingobacteriaceae bacterium]